MTITTACQVILDFSVPYYYTCGHRSALTQHYRSGRFEAPITLRWRFTTYDQWLN
jgi:hypothetical protein